MFLVRISLVGCTFFLLFKKLLMGLNIRNFFFDSKKNFVGIFCFSELSWSTLDYYWPSY